MCALLARAQQDQKIVTSDDGRPERCTSSIAHGCMGAAGHTYLKVWWLDVRFRTLSNSFCRLQWCRLYFSASSIQPTEYRSPKQVSMWSVGCLAVSFRGTTCAASTTHPRMHVNINPPRALQVLLFLLPMHSLRCMRHKSRAVHAEGATTEPAPLLQRYSGSCSGLGGAHWGSTWPRRTRWRWRR